jgi:hypothetical protein
MSILDLLLLLPDVDMEWKRSKFSSCRIYKVKRERENVDNLASEFIQELNLKQCPIFSSYYSRKVRPLRFWKR